MNKKGFSFLELIIAISIIALLAVIGLSINNSYKQTSDNTKVVSDLSTIKNSITSYIQENKSAPMPEGNNNFYSNDSSYVHSYEDAFGVYGSITENTLSKKYIEVIPLDPRTNSYYSYGKTIATNDFEVAGVQIIDAEATTYLDGNYKADGGTTSLIREYNGPNFIYNGSTLNLPYNPDELILIARDNKGNTYKQGDIITAGPLENIEIYFSDGSISVIEKNTTIVLDKLSFPKENNLKTIINLTLQAGVIWTKATKLDEGSEFKVYTSDSVASVRGTIFKVSYNGSETEVTVLEGEVDIYKKGVSTDNLIGTIEVLDGEEPASKKIIASTNEIVDNIITKTKEEFYIEIEGIFPKIDQNINIEILVENNEILENTSTLKSIENETIEEFNEVNEEEIEMENNSEEEVEEESERTYSGKGCNECPFGYYTDSGNRRDKRCGTFGWGGERNERYCNYIIGNDGLEVICELEDSDCDDYDKKTWTGIYNENNYYDDNDYDDDDDD